MSVSSPGGRLPVSATRLEALAIAVLKAEKVKDAVVSVTCVSTRAMATLNKQHLKHAGATDVITFGLGTDPAGTMRADIYICTDVAREQSREHGVGVREEMQRLLTHGLLHACGHDHPVDDSRTTSPMWRRQETLLKRFLDSNTEAR
ncbi:MAG: rRNA maturation RNase YbeY [Phycisphaerae bacterium]|nr:rRNA maturation RNase YbeY [Gemmatimonadaceae bacterium]